MHYLLMALLAAMALAMTGVARAETVQFDTQTLEVEPLVADDFAAGLDAWETDAAVAVEKGRMVLGPEGGALLREPVDGPQLITFIARVAARGEASAVFCGSPDGFHVASYAVVFAPEELRLAENPGDRMVDHNANLGTAAAGEYRVAIVKIGLRIRVFVNDRLALDWWDHSAPGAGEEPLPGGRIAFSADGTRMQVADFAVRRITSNRVEMIDRLKDLSLESDLRASTIAIGDSQAQREPAERIADAIRERTGATVEVIADPDPDELLPGDRPLIVLGCFADNPVIERLYNQWYTIVDRRFPGPGGYYLQTIHDPYGAGDNIVVVGASDDAGLARAADEFIARIPADGVIGRLYQVAASDEYMALTGWDYGERLIIPAGWPQHFALGNYGSRDDPRHSGIVYLLTGDDAWAERYREQMLRWIQQGLQGHLYVPGWMEIWDLMEEHPVFSDEERLAITNWFLTQVRSQECIGALHIQRWPWGMPHQNHGTRPGIGTFFMARYFRQGYGLTEMDVYLSRIADYFGMQDDWSKPMCDSCMHQWEATLEDKAIYALASGNDRFFSTGAARLAAERALRTTSNTGMLPTFGDGQYGSGAYTLLAKAAYYYGDGRFLWPNMQRPDEPMAGTDEVLRTYLGDVLPVRPDDIVGVSVIPYDTGFWHGWRNLPEVRFFNPPTIAYEQAFDKIAMRTGLDLDDEFLLLDGMVGASHDYDDTNTIHLYSRHGREYLVTYDGLPSSTIAWHNGVNIIRDGLSTHIPYFAERLHAADLGPVMLSQTRVNDFADADWTRTVMLAPDRCFVVIDAMTAREPGTFAFTGHWKTLGEPEMDGDTLTIAQWPLAEGRSADNETYFHLQTPAQRVTHKQLPYKYGLNARYYPYARPLPNMVAQSMNSELAAGETAFLCTLGHETGNVVQPQYVMHRVGPGVVRVEGPQFAAYAGAPVGPVEIGALSIDADAFYLTADALTVAGGRRAQIGGTVVLSADGPVTLTLSLADGAITSGSGECAIAPLSADARAALAAQLASAQHDLLAAAATVAEGAGRLTPAWQYDAGGAVDHLRAFAGNPGAEVLAPDRPALPASFGVVAVPSEAGAVAFLDARGAEVARMETGVRVHDVCVADLDGDGGAEVLLARADSTLECRNADGSTRWSYAPEKQTAVNSTLYIPSNPALYTFVVDLAGERTVCVATGDQRLHGLTPDGEPRWMFWSYAGLFGIHGLYDVSGDGTAELIGGNPEVSSTDTLYFLDGGDRWMRRVLSDGWGATLSSMAIADVNADGRPEIAFGTGRAGLHVIAPTMDDDGRLFQHQLGDDVRGLEIIAAPDGGPLIVTGATSEFVSAFDGEGAKRWAAAVGGPVLEMTSAIVDGSPVIIAALEGGEILVLSTDGAVRWQGAIEGTPAALTVTAGDDPLIIVADDAGRVSAFTIPQG